MLQDREKVKLVSAADRLMKATSTIFIFLT